MLVGHNRIIAGVLVGLGVVCLVLAFFALSVDHSVGLSKYGPVFAGGVCTLMGVLMFSRPMFALEDDRVVVFALLGPAKRAYPFASKRDLRITDGKLYVGGKKVPVSRGRSNPDDWDRLARNLDGVQS